MSLSKFVHALGRGPARSRHLTRDEAKEALGLILRGEAAPEATGALLMLLRYRGENADEIAGFVDATRNVAAPWPGQPAAIDWPSYAAGRSRGLPWFLLSAKLLAGAGYPVLLQGWNSAAHQSDNASVRGALPLIGIEHAASINACAAAMERDGIAYLPLEVLCPEALAVLRLRDVFGLRSPINTALRLVNPSGARTSVQGVFHPPYRGLQTDASKLLGQPNQMVLKGAGGEFERLPAKDVSLLGLRDGQEFEEIAPAIIPEARGRLADGPASDHPGALATLWSGAEDDAFAETIVTGTAAAALFAAGVAPNVAKSETLAAEMWAGRNKTIEKA